MPTSRRDFFPAPCATRRTFRIGLGKKPAPKAIRDAVQFRILDSLNTYEPASSGILALNKVDIALDKASLGVPLKMDVKTERFIGNDKANDMLTRHYRGAVRGCRNMCE